MCKMNIIWKRWVLILAALLTGIPIAAAQESNDSSPDSQSYVSEEPGPFEEIVVTGRRLGQEMGLEAKRNSKQIIDVLSAADAGRLPDNNIAESLSRIPGVSVQRDGNSGNGDFISIRGLDSALNNIQFNGVNSGLANPSYNDRRVPLDGISAEDISEIRVAKSLLPQDEGEGIGGAVNIRTKTPLERGEDQFRINASGRHSEFADKEGYEVGLGFNKLIGDNWGVSFSVNQRRRHIENIEVNAISSNPDRLPEIRDAAGNVVPVDDIINGGGVFNEPGDSYDNITEGFFSVEDISFENERYELNNDVRDTLSINAAIDWQMSDSTQLTLGGFLSKQDSVGSEFMLDFDVDEDVFENIQGVATTMYDDTEVDFEAYIRDTEEVNGNLFLRGVTEFDKWKIRYQASYAHASANIPVSKLLFNTGSLIPGGSSPATFHPFQTVDTYFPVPNSAGVALPEVRQALTDFAGTQKLYDFEQDLDDQQENDRIALRFDADYFLDAAFFGGTASTVTFGAKIERSDVKKSNMMSTRDDAWLNCDGTYAPGKDGSCKGKTLSEITGLYGGLDINGLDNIGSPLANIGINPETGQMFGVMGIPTLDMGVFRQLASTFRESFLASGDGLQADRFFDVQEDVAAVYGQVELDWDRLNIIAGARIEHYEGEFFGPTYLNMSLELNSDMIDLTNNESLDGIPSDTSNTEILPRIAGTFRLNEKVQFRGGIGVSLARPTFSQLGRPNSIRVQLEANDDFLPGGTTAADVASAGITLADLSDANLRVSTGNPDLDNSRSTNIDFSVEYYPYKGTALSAGLFHKKIDNFIFLGVEPLTGGTSFDVLNKVLSEDGLLILDQLGGVSALQGADFDVALLQTKNGDTATVYGLELGFAHTFDYLQGFVSNMGINGNVTFTESEADFQVGGLSASQDAIVALGFANDGDTLYRTASFFGAPDLSGNLAIYYEANGLEVALSASYQDEAFDQRDDYGLDQYKDSYFQADFFMAYQLPLDESYGTYNVFLGIQDITDDGTKATDARTVGRGTNLFDERSFNGREINIGIRGQF